MSDTVGADFICLAPIRKGEVRGGEAEQIGKKVQELIASDGPLAGITWHTATLNVNTHQIIVEGTRLGGEPYQLTIHAANTINNTKLASAEGPKRIADTAAAIACLGFGNSDDSTAAYRNVLTRLMDEASGLIITFGGLMDRRSL